MKLEPVAYGVVTGESQYGLYWANKKFQAVEEVSYRNCEFVCKPQTELVGLYAIPDGYVVVPVGPTDAMIEAGVQAENASFRAQPDECWMKDARKAMMLAGYKAMIAAKEQQ